MLRTPSKINLKKYPALNYHQDLATICSPLLKEFGYSIVNFIRVYDDNRVLYLCDNRDWLSFYLEINGPAIGAFEQNTEFRRQETILWNALDPKDPIVIYSCDRFNIKYGVTFIQKFSGGYDFFNLGVNQDSHLQIEKILSQTDSIQRFFPIFYEKTRRIIAATQQDPWYLDDFNHAANPNKKIPDRLYLGPTYEYQYLTPSEVNCLKNLLKGMTTPEIAQIQQISTRTLEKHIENIKQKLGCRTQYELGYKAAKLGIELPT